MELRHLRYFVAVADELHFGRAAERLHMAQPPLSQQIKLLEQELGVILFHRSKRKVELSQAGQVFLAEARDILARAEAAKASAVRAARGELGRLDIGFTGSAPFNQVMPDLLRRFRRAWPDVRLSLQEVSTTQQIEEIAQGRLDIGFARPADASALEAVAARRILREQLLVAMPADHRLAGRSPLALAELAGEGFVMHPRRIGTGLYDKILYLCQRAGFRPRVVLEAHQLSTSVGLAAAGLALAIVPHSLSRIALDGVAYGAIDDDQAFIDLALIHRKGDTSPMVANFLSVI